jgi:AraC family cel operon transcriptional repressor
LVGESWIHAVRVRYAPGDTYDLHDHSFHELFWIEEGTAVHVLASGRQELPAGSLIYLQPGDAHGFATQGTVGFTLVNVTVRSSLVTTLEQRWAGSLGEWPWSGPERSRSRQLGSRVAVRLQEWADDLLHDGSQLSAETFLLDLLRMTSANRPLVLVGGLPAWLQRALGCLDDPLVLAGGVAAFVATTGHSVDQVNRAVRVHLGKTTRDLVTERRLALAERRLRATNEPILTIASDCGYASLSHFYRAFTGRYGSTPRSMRKAAQAAACPKRVRP